MITGICNTEDEFREYHFTVQIAEIALDTLHIIRKSVTIMEQRRGAGSRRCAY